MDSRVLAAMEPYFSDVFYNPSADYLSARKTKAALSKSREEIARVLGARPAEIVFTAGATEANNLAIQGILRQYPNKVVLVSAIEHESVIKPAGLFAGKKVPVKKDGIIDVQDLTKMVNDDVVLISVGLVNHEIGTVQPIREVAQIVGEIRHARLKSKNPLPLYLHTDAAQAANYFDLHTARLSVDLMSLNGGKIYGPKQSGALFVKAGTILKPLILGGGQEFGLRSGTENLASIGGFCRALSIAQQSRLKEKQRVEALKKFFINQAQDEIRGISFNTPKTNSSPHIINFSITGQDNERLAMELDERGIQVATGSACSASSDTPSHVLKAIGLSDAQARASLRLSMGKHTSKAQLVIMAKSLKQLTEVNR